MISAGRQYGVRSPMVAQYHPIRDKKGCLSIRSRGTPSCHHPVHAEKKPIIGSAGVVNPIQVDDSRLYQAAEFEQMVPIAAVTSEPRGVEAQHSANLSGTQPCNQLFEAGPRHHPTGGPAEIVIDHLDVVEAPLPRDIYKFVLPPQ